MYFNSYVFILFFLPVAVAGYFLLQKRGWHRAAAYYMAGMTLWFCGYGNPWNTVIFVLLILVNYFFVRRIRGREQSRTEDALPAKAQAQPEHRKHCLITGVILDALVLVAFKFSGTLPLGISFYTFQMISYLADCYQGKCEDQTFGEYVQYMCFFPRFLQGPIVLQEEFIPELRNEENRQASYEQLGRGLYAFALGLGKKVLLADALAKIVDQGYADVAALNASEALLVMVGYSLQLYFDFSGYCDMACGIGMMLHLKLPVNFNSPYKAASISEFWKRWHMTLTRFFTRYVYIPLGGSRQGMAKTLRNTMIVFLISGFWHGTNWTFLVWGALHGTWMIMERVTGYTKWRLPHSLKVLWTFILNTFAWSIFRAESLGQAWELWMRIFQGGFGRIGSALTESFNDLVEISVIIRAGMLFDLKLHPGIPAVITVAFLLIACFTMQNTLQKAEKMKWNVWNMLVTVGILFVSILSLSDIAGFLYVNF